MATKPRRAATNVRGRKPRDAEIRKMRRLGYVTAAEGAKAVGRAASSIYERIATNTLPRVHEKREPVVKTASGNVWIYLPSLKKLYVDPAEVAQGRGP